MLKNFNCRFAGWCKVLDPCETCKLEKVCKVCGLPGEFYNQRLVCKSCYCKKQQEYKKEFAPAELRAYFAGYRIKNRERLREYNRLYMRRRRTKKQTTRD